METKRLDNAALAAGISPDYINAHGKPQSIAAATKQRLLDAMHRTTTAAKAAVVPLPPVQVFTHGKKMSLPVAGRGEFSGSSPPKRGNSIKAKCVEGRASRCQPNCRKAIIR
jgi:4-alpha-glucanotransferase